MKNSSPVPGSRNKSLIVIWSRLDYILNVKAIMFFVLFKNSNVNNKQSCSSDRNSSLHFEKILPSPHYLEN